MINPEKNYTYLVTTGEPKHRMAEAIGCNLLISNQGSLPGPRETKKWRQVIAALDDLQMGWMRIGIIPTAEAGAWDDRRQRWDFHHPHFQVLRKVGRWATASDVRLMFDPFAVPRSFRRRGARFADDPRDFAEKLLLPVARYFQREKLTSFRYLGLLNESIWGPGKEGFTAIRPFYDLYKAVRDTLDENGITDRQLGLLGPSNLSSWEWPIADFFAAGVDPDQLWVGYDQHLYLYHFDWINENSSDFMSLTEMTERYLRRYADYAHKRNKPLFITELGNMYSGRLFWGERDFEGPATHTSLLMDAELIVRSINEGVDGFLRWAFSVNPTRDGRWSLLENSGADMMPAPHAYPLYRLLMRAVRPRATVLQSHVAAALGGFRYVFPAAVCNADGNACVLLINDAPGKNFNVGLHLQTPFKGRKLHRIVCDENRKGTALSPVAINRDGEGAVMLTPASLTVLSLKPIQD
jgi:hypothetical protein